MNANANLKSIDITMGEVRRKTYCRICGGLCGLEVITDGKKVIRVLPDKTHPYSWRDFCLKGGSADKVRDHPQRIRTPMKRVGDKYVAVSYEQAIKEIAAQLNDIRRKHGPHAIAGYVGNPGGLNSANMMFHGGFMAGLGTSNNFFVGSIDQNSFHVVGQEMFGSEFTILDPDVDHAKSMLLIGTNPAVSLMIWLETTPNGWNRVLAAQKNGADLIVVDPRETATTKKANTHVRIRPGEDWAFLLGLIKVVFENGWQHQQDCDEAEGVDRLRAVAEKSSLADLSARCEVAETMIRDVARRFATAESGFCVTRTGVALTKNGTLGEWLGHALNLITGRIDRKGGRYFQPGLFKDTLGLINKMSPPVARRSRIGNHAAIAGSYPLAILPDEIATPGQDQIRALIINAGNPVVSGPDGNKLDAALAQLELLISVDLFQRESHRHAHWLIPGVHFLEREDFMSLFSHTFEVPFIQLGQAAIEPLDGIKPEWEFFRDLAVEMNVPFMKIPGLNPVIRFSRWLAKKTDNPRHAFNPRWIWAFMVKAFGVAKWKDIKRNPQGIVYGEKSYGHFKAALQTSDRRIHAAPEPFMSALKQRLAEPLPAKNAAYPFQLVNQRQLSMMNSWLVETVKRTEVYGDFVEINPADAEAKGIRDDQEVMVSSDTATVKARARITEAVPPGIVSMDHGWGSRLFDPAGGNAPVVQGVARNMLVSGEELDELSGVPCLNGSRVDVCAAA